MFISICLSRRRPTSDNEWFASSSFVDFKIVVTIFTVYFCNFSLISLPLFTSLINFTCVDECVLRYIFSTNIWCSKIVNLWWIKGVEFRYSWAISINDFRNTFHVVVVCSTLKFDKFLSNNTLTENTWCFLSCICCGSYRFVTSNITISWGCELLPCKTCLSIACKNCFISSWFVCLTFCVLATVNDFIVSCLISFSIRNRSLNVLFVFTLVTWVVSITDLKCFILKVSIYQWEGNVTWISSVSSCVCQSVSYIRVIVCDVAWKWDIAFSRFDCTSVNFWTIRLLNDTQVNIWVSWKATCDCWTVYWKCSVVIKVCFSTSSVVCFKELPYTESETICVWIQSITSFIEGCIFNRCTISIWNNWVSIYTTSSACWDWCQLCSNCCNTVNYWVTCEAVVSDLSHHVVNSVTKSLTLFCVSSVCCWCSKQCCWFSNFFLNCCDSSLDFSFSSCISQLSLVIFSDTYKQFCFWNVLIQDSFFIFLSSCFWCSCSCWSCWFWSWRWFWVWTTVAFSVWLAFRCWVHFAKWYRFWDSLWQFCWYRLWYWNWSICACLSVNWRACRLLTSWCWSFWSYCFWYWSSAQGNWIWVSNDIMICSCLAFHSWCSCFFGLSSVSCYCATCHSTCCCNPFKKSCTWKKRRFFFYILNCYWRSICATFNNFEKSKVRCCSTKPVFTRFDKFEASHAISFAEFTFVTSKKHIYLLKNMSYFLI